MLLASFEEMSTYCASSSINIPTLLYVPFCNNFFVYKNAGVLLSVFAESNTKEMSAAPTFTVISEKRHKHRSMDKSILNSKYVSIPFHSLPLHFISFRFFSFLPSFPIISSHYIFHFISYHLISFPSVVLINSHRPQRHILRFLILSIICKGTHDTNVFNSYTNRNKNHLLVHLSSFHLQQVDLFFVLFF